MRYLLDTTYLLPTVGISVKKISSDDVARLWNENFQIAISEITVFELSAKAAKYVLKGALDPARVSRGLETIMNDDLLVKLYLYESKQLSVSFRLGEMLVDFIDCLILSTAMTHTDGLITEDGDLHNLKRDEGFKQLARTMNPKFDIRRLADFI